MQKENKDLIMQITHSNLNLKLNAPSVIKYFCYVFKIKTNGGEYKLFGSRGRISQSLKSGVIDYLVLNDLGIDGLIDFIDWVFDTQKPEKWHVHLLPYQLTNWNQKRVIEKLKSDKIRMVRQQIDYREEEQYLKFLGEGYFDDQLTKTQYWVGLRWRLRNLPQAQLDKVEIRHKRYPCEIIDRLHKWEVELYESVNFDPMRQFYIELAMSHRYTIGTTLKRFGREIYSKLFTAEELEKIPEKNT